VIFLIKKNPKQTRPKLVYNQNNLIETKLHNPF